MELLRDLYPGEDDYFKKNPHVSGMATQDNRVILNPYSNLSQQEQRSVYNNEAMRLYMRNENVQPNFDLTQQQQQQFVGTPYENNPLQLKRSIIARIFSGDPSANATEEQRARAQSVIDAFRRYNFK